MFHSLAPLGQLDWTVPVWRQYESGYHLLRQPGILYQLYGGWFELLLESVVSRQSYQKLYAHFALR